LLSIVLLPTNAVFIRVSRRQRAFDYFIIE